MPRARTVDDYAQAQYSQLRVAHCHPYYLDDDIRYRAGGGTHTVFETSPYEYADSSGSTIEITSKTWGLVEKRNGERDNNNLHITLGKIEGTGVTAPERSRLQEHGCWDELIENLVLTTTMTLMCRWWSLLDARRMVCRILACCIVHGMLMCG